MKTNNFAINIFKNLGKVMIAAGGSKFVEVIDLINPQFRRRFIEPRCCGANGVKAAGLLGKNPVICGITLQKKEVCTQ